MIALTTAEARRLFNHATRIARDAGHHQHWSDWRRRHQARARRCHYQHRTTDHGPPLLSSQEAGDMTR
jgi:hypothetical protein